MRQYLRAFAGAAIFALLFFGIAVVIGIVVGGARTFESLVMLTSQPIGIMGIAIIGVLVLSLAYYIELPWGKISTAAKKLESLGIKPEDDSEEYYAKAMEEAAIRLAKAEGELLRMKESGTDLDNKSKYLAQTEQALLNILEDVEDANLKLKELDQLKSDFLNVTSHELRTPLTPLVAYTDLMEQGKLGPLTEEQKQALSVVKRNANRLKFLISDILDIAKLEGRRMKYIMETQNMNKLVSTVVAEQQTTAKKRGIMIKMDGITRLPKLKVDGSRIMQVLNNLLNNAIKFSSDGTEIRVGAKTTRTEVIISVSDKGMGIPAGDIPKLFNMFYQSRRTMTRNAEGSGLGLAISRWIVEDHGGRIWVSSKQGAGSTFMFALPKKFNPKTANIVGNMEKANTVSEARGSLEKGEEN